MAVRQYIGARYVPLYAGDWDSTKNYEPLTIVTDANGNSFTSLKDVPAGTALTDRNFWIQTSSFSGAVDTLQRRVSAVESDISGINVQISTLDSGLSDVNARIDELDVEKTHFAIFGDSWIEYGVPNGKIAADYLAARTGYTMHDYALGGTGFDVSGGYDDQIATFATDVNAPKDKIRFVILVAGLNEHGGTTTSAQFAEKLNDWYVKLSNVLDLTKVPVYWFQNYSIENAITGTNFTTYEIQVGYYRNVNELLTHDVIYVPMFGWIDSWTNDRHPDATGAVQFADNMYRVISGTPPVLRKYQTITGTINDSNLAENLRSVTIDFYINSENPIKLRPFIRIAMLGLARVASGSAVTFTHGLPARLANVPLEQDICIISSNYAGFSLQKMGTGQTWTSTGGMMVKEVDTQ